MSAEERFMCTACRAMLLKWQGQCPSCGEWGSVKETARPPRRAARLAAPPEPITRVETGRETRLATGFGEVDRVLGGGLVAGSAVLVGGDPGIGKSTLMTLLGHRLAAAGRTVLYVTGEESAAQVRLRAERLDALDERLLLLPETRLEGILAQIEAIRPAACIVDSIQTVHSPGLAGGPGTVAQVREAAGRLVGLAKAAGTALWLVGHVTKDGTLAGPRTLEHLVDVVLGFDGDRHHAFRLLRSAKNRFGAAGEVAVLEMGSRGLTEVANPSRLFLRDRHAEEPGSVIAPAFIGTRIFLVEIQALAVPAAQGPPRRIVSGLDPRRAQLVLAILERRGGFDLAGLDVYVNVVGGIEVEEPAADLPLALAIASALAERPVPADLVATGELGLMGEIRAVPRLDARLAETARLGFARALVPADPDGPPADAGRPPGLAVQPAADLTKALEVTGALA
ncbi:MAG: DNA repair protein RadA [Planctomycetes bacterium]|nr:DNA repair protein RadA [Planctomycetota bacterium]